MKQVFRFPSLLRCAGVALAVCSFPAFAADDATTQAQQRFHQDMSQCSSVQLTQDRRTCRLEARNALAESKRGALTNPGAELQGNAQQRCAVHQGLDRTACEARMRGEGSVDGSVDSGGVLRKTVVVVPAS